MIWYSENWGFEIGGGIFREKGRYYSKNIYKESRVGYRRIFIEWRVGYRRIYREWRVEYRKIYIENGG